MRKCSKCGVDSKNSMCQVCKQEYNRQHYKKYKEMYLKKGKEKRQAIKAYLNEYKAGVGCSVCGEHDPVVLDFHHIDNEKKEVGLSNVGSMKKAKEEIKKCIVVCANCHRRIHHSK